jgi:hypothetical protein
MNALPKNVQQWLRRMPRPTHILADDKRVEVPNHGRAWKDLTATLIAMNPRKLTALDISGTVLRSIEVDGEETDREVSPEMSDVQLFAKEIALAYDRGSKVNQPLIDNIISFVDRQAQQIQKMSSEIDRLRNHNLKLQSEILAMSVEPQGGEDGGLLSAVVQGIAAGEAAKADNVKAIKGAKQP